MARYIIDDPDGKLSPSALRDAIASLASERPYITLIDGGQSFSLTRRPSYTIDSPSEDDVRRVADVLHMRQADARHLLLVQARLAAGKA